MDEEVIRKQTIRKVGRKFYGHDSLYSKYTPQIPEAAEREYMRMTNEYMRLLKEELEENLPELKESYKANRDELVADNRRMDAATDLMLKVNELFTRMKSNLLKKTVGFGLRRRLESLAHLNRKLTVKEWKRAIKATLGIDIREDYYLGEFYSEQLLEWVKQNVDLISTIPEDTLDKMKDIVYDGYTNGRTTTRMVKDIQRVYRISKRHATLIARDQTAKLNRKVPFTDGGIGLIEGVMDSTLKDGQDIGGIAPTEYDDDDNPIYGYSVTVPKASDLTEAERKSRKLTGCKWSARLAGAIHAVEISGNLTF